MREMGGIFSSLSDKSDFNFPMYENGNRTKRGENKKASYPSECLESILQNINLLQMLKTFPVDSHNVSPYGAKIFDELL